jgi:hypothetical protein
MARYRLFKGRTSSMTCVGVRGALNTSTSSITGNGSAQTIVGNLGSRRLGSRSSRLRCRTKVVWRQSRRDWIGSRSGWSWISVRIDVVFWSVVLWYKGLYWMVIGFLTPENMLLISLSSKPRSYQTIPPHHRPAPFKQCSFHMTYWAACAMIAL